MTQANAYISSSAKIGKNVKIDYNSYIGDKVSIGDGSVVGPNAVIMGHTKIGKNCKVFPGAVLGCIPQDLKYAREESFVEIGDNTSIREFVTVHRGTADKMVTKVGNNCLVMAYVHIAHDCSIGNHCIIGNNVQMAGHIVVDDWAIIGGASAIHQKLHIGKHSFVGAVTYLGKDVPPFVKVRGNPHNSYAGINSIGLRRRNFNQKQINQILDIYRIIYNSDRNVSQALEELSKSNFDNEIRKEISCFIENSKRGIIQRIKNSPENEEIE